MSSLLVSAPRDGRSISSAFVQRGVRLGPRWSVTLWILLHSIRDITGWVCSAAQGDALVSCWTQPVIKSCLKTNMGKHEGLNSTFQGLNVVSDRRFSYWKHHIIHLNRIHSGFSRETDRIWFSCLIVAHVKDKIPPIHTAQFISLWEAVKALQSVCCEFLQFGQLPSATSRQMNEEMRWAWTHQTTGWVAIMTLGWWGLVRVTPDRVGACLSPLWEHSAAHYFPQDSQETHFPFSGRSQTQSRNNHWAGDTRDSAVSLILSDQHRWESVEK